MRRRVRRRRALVWWGILPGALLVAIIIVVVLISRGPLPNPNNRSATLIPSGKTFNVTPESYVAFATDLPIKAHLTGAFGASLSIEAFVLNNYQFSHISSSGTPRNWTWSSGNTTSASLTVDVKNGSWFFDFVNSNETQTSQVTITTAFQARE